MISKRSYDTACRHIVTLKYWEIGCTDFTSLGLSILDVSLHETTYYFNYFSKRFNERFSCPFQISK